MEGHDTEPDAPLIGTLWFVIVMGLCFAAGWFGLYLLMKGRW